MTKTTSTRFVWVSAMLLAAATTASPAVAQPAQDEEAARVQFRAGVALLEDPEGAKYEQAYRAFKKAYELSRSPKVLGNVGFCAMQLERDGEAIDAYAAYLREVDDVPERERAQIEKDLSTMRATTAKIRVTTKEPVSAATLVDHRSASKGPRVENEYVFEGTEISLRVRPGRHTLRLRTGDGRESLPLEVTTDPASESSYEIVFPPPKREVPDAPPAPAPAPAPVAEAAPPSLLGPGALAVVGGAAIVTGVVSGLIARGKANDVKDDCPNGLCPAGYPLADNRTDAMTFGTIADVSFIAGGAMLAGAVTWYLLLPKSKEAPKSSAERRSGGWASSVGCTPTGCGFQFQRGF